MAYAWMDTYNEKHLALKSLFPLMDESSKAVSRTFVSFRRTIKEMFSWYTIPRLDRPPCSVVYHRNFHWLLPVRALGNVVGFCCCC